MGTTTDSLLLQTIESGRPSLDALTRPLRELTNESSTLVIGYGIGQAGVRESMIPYFHIIGSDRGHPPLRILLVGGWGGRESFTPLAIARFLALVENQPDLISGCEITAYPVANLEAYKGTSEPAEPDRCWNASPSGHARVMENELQRYPYDIAILLAEGGKTDAAEFWAGDTPASQAIEQALAKIQPTPVNHPDSPRHPRIFTPTPKTSPSPCELHLLFPEATPSRTASEKALASLENTLADIRGIL